MFVDASDVPAGSVLEADVCIVGGGAAGITLARELGRRRLRVTLLESGGFTPDDVTQSLYAGEVQGRAYFDLAAPGTRTRCFGGTTHQWAGECRPLESLDFEARDWIADSGWPLRLSDLLPYYEKAQAVCQLGPFAYAGEDWRESGAQALTFAGGSFGTRALHYSPPTRFGAVYREPLKAAENVIAYLHANVVGLETSPRAEHVTGVKVACVAGNRFRVRARCFILATGGIENPRLLLQSNQIQSKGLGNEHDQVGRYFMEHLYLVRAAAFLAPADAFSNFYLSGIWSQGRRIQGILALNPEIQRQEKLTNFSAVLSSESPRETLRAWRSIVGALRRGRVPRGAMAHIGNTMRLLGARATHSRKVDSRKWPLRLYLIKQVMEQAPNPESRVVLTGERDALGCPRVALRWRLSAVDKRTAHRSHEILADELRRAGIGRLRSFLGKPDDPWPEDLRGARHHMGTTRMHSHPRHGVVDADCRVHGITNLYIAGSSVFPTSGSANPTLTIVALALRLADHLHGLLR